MPGRTRQPDRSGGLPEMPKSHGGILDRATGLDELADMPPIMNGAIV